MTRVLITGVSGAAGVHLARHALSMGADVFGVALDTVHVDGIRSFQGDLTEPGVIRSLISDLRPDLVFHLAALVPATVAHTSPEALIRVNVLGTLHLLEAVKELAVDARTLVVSSAAVYGAVPSTEQPISETIPFNPTTPYGSSKAMQDLLAGQYAVGHGLSVMRARTFNQIGPGTQPGLVAGTLVRQVAEIAVGTQEPEISVRYLSTRRDFLDVRDIVRAYWDILEHGRPGAAYNVCSGEGYTVGDVLDELLAIAGLDGVRVLQRQESLLAGDVSVSVGDPARLIRETGWRPEISLWQSLRDMLDERLQQIEE